jgi:NitT/TauT family transport system permease protein
VRRFLVATAFFVGLVGLWHALATWGPWPPWVIPPPFKVAKYLVGAVQDGSLLEATEVTGKRLGIGYALGLVIGLPLGFLTARVRGAADTLGVLALGLQTLPSVCWVPLALLWFGATETAVLFVLVMGTVWSILLATDHGVRSVPPIYARAARTMGSKRLHTLFFVVFPAALPFVLSGMKQGWAFAWRSLMAAELFVTIVTGYGLGYLLHYGREFNRVDQMLGVMFVIVLVGLAVDQVLFAPAERWLHRRWGTGRIET